MGFCITLLNSGTYFLSSVLPDISAIDIDKSMPNIVISFSICTEAMDAILETSDLGLGFSELGLVVGDRVLRLLININQLD